MNLTDRMNPVFLRDLRRSVRARDFNVIFFGLLTGGLVLALFALQSSSAGAIITTAIGIGLTVLFFIILPLRVTSSIIAETKDQVQDLVKITPLKPSKIIIGTLCSTMVIGIVSTSALAPFLATAYFFGGTPFWIVLLFAAGPVLAGPLFLSLTLALNTGLEFKFSQSLGRLLVLVAGIAAFMGVMRLTQMAMMSASKKILFDTLLQYCILYPFIFTNCILVARSRLLPPMADRSSAVKTGWLIAFSVYLGMWIHGFELAAGSLLTRDTLDAYVESALFSNFYIAAVLSFFFITEAPASSRRVLKQLEKRNILRRILGGIFGPGAGRGVIYSLVCFFLLVGFGELYVKLTMNSVPFSTAFCNNIYKSFYALFAYTFFFLGLPTTVLNSFSRFQIAPLLKRIAIVFFFVFSTLLTHLAGFLFQGTGSIIWGLNPFVMIGRIQGGEGTDGQLILIILLGTAGLISYIYILVDSRTREQSVLSKGRSELPATSRDARRET